MKFLYPEFLWSFLLLAIPIVIHLFNFKRYKTLYFSSLSFVKHVDQKTKSVQRLKHLLILASRLLAFIFLVFAFAQPYFSDANKKVESNNTLIAFYVDNSFSMQAKGSDGELLSEARENARQIIEKAPLDTRFLIGTNEMSGSEERILNKVEAFEKLDDIKHSPIVRTLEEMIQWQFQRLSDDELQNESAATQYILLSDFQKSGELNKIDNLPKNVSIYPIKLNAENINNVNIDSVWFSSPIHKLSSKNELNVRLNNFNKATLENVEISINIGDFQKTIYTDIEGKQNKTVQIDYKDKTTGVKNGSVHVVDDNILFDDTYYLSYEVRSNVNVLIIDGEDAIPNFMTVYSLDNFYTLKETEITSITKNDFDEKDLVLLNGANKISKGVINYLIEFTQTGGTLGLFPGKSAESSDWNDLLKELQLPTIGKVVASGNKISKINYNDPFFDGVFEIENDKLNLPSVSKIYRAQQGLSSLNTNLLTLQNGLPLLSWTQKKGNHFMFYSSLHDDFGNFSKDALFSTLTLRIGELSQRNQPIFVIIGDDSRYPIYKKINSDQPIHIQNKEFDFIPQISTISGVNYISLNSISDQQQLLSGNYLIKNEETIGALSLNYDRKESELNYYSEIELVNYLKSSGSKEITFHDLGKNSPTSIVNIAKPFSYWKICIILTFIFVLIEMALVRFLK